MVGCVFLEQFELPLLRAPIEEGKVLGKRNARYVEKELKDVQQICEDATRVANSSNKEQVRAVLLSAISRMKVIHRCFHTSCAQLLMERAALGTTGVEEID